LLVFLGALAACGSSSKSESSSTTSTTVAATTTVAPTSTTTPEQGAAVAAAVMELQRVMTDLGYYSGPIDGVYGDATTAGVKAMQKNLGVTVDGLYGPETHQALKAKSNEKATDIVKAIQTALAKYGYYSGPIDGNYGDATTTAVKKLQMDLGVTVDGRFGPETAAAFNQAVATGKIKPV
jgi:peptidoglycan hydrolase-like protein with peptidoglycan-binding domain